jgi:hypothetical protein
MNTLYAYKKEINVLCANHKVRTLYAFGVRRQNNVDFWS